VSGDAPEAAAPAAPPRRRWWRHWKLILAGIVATPALLIALFAWTALHWSYSHGERAGTLQKFSNKGWLCKTWEGELMQPTAPGVAPTVWTFTVRDAGIARQMNLGLGRHVVLRYEEHRGVPTSCFGDTPYYVVGVRLDR
jgi:hypothetical protein